MDAFVLTTRVVDGIAVITHGTDKRIHIDQETSDALFAALTKCAGDADARVVIITGTGPGQCVRHYSIPALIGFAESVRPLAGRERSDIPVFKGLSTPADAEPTAGRFHHLMQQDG